MKFILSIFLASILFAFPISAKEQIDLTTPDQAIVGTFTYSIAQLVLDRQHGRIVINLIGDNGQRKVVIFGDAENARSMLRVLNTANLSNKSLYRRIMEELISNGNLAGTISGTPD